MIWCAVFLRYYCAECYCHPGTCPQRIRIHFSGDSFDWLYRSVYNGLPTEFGLVLGAKIFGAADGLVVEAETAVLSDRRIDFNCRQLPAGPYHPSPDLAEQNDCSSLQCEPPGSATPFASPEVVSVLEMITAAVSYSKFESGAAAMHAPRSGGCRDETAKRWPDAWGASCAFIEVP